MKILSSRASVCTRFDFRLRAERPRRRGQGKSGKELREEYFMAAKTGQERGLPEGAFLNDNTTGEEPQTEVTWEPYGDKITASQVHFVHSCPWPDSLPGIFHP